MLTNWGRRVRFERAWQVDLTEIKTFRLLRDRDLRILTKIQAN